jgi:hypothetical protein
MRWVALWLYLGFLRPVRPESAKVGSVNSILSRQGVRLSFVMLSNKQRQLGVAEVPRHTERG